MKKQKGYSPVLIILLIAIIGILVYISYKYQSFFYQKLFQSASPSPSGISITGNWNTYVNTKYKYSIKYPADFSNNQPIPADEIAVIFKPSSYSAKTAPELLTLPEITLDIVPNSTSLQDSLNQIKSASFNTVTNITDIKINNIDSIQFNLTSSRSGTNNPGFDILIKTGSGNILHMSLSNYQSSQSMLDTFNQMIFTYQIK